MNLKALPVQDRPRERLSQIGPDALSTIELLAILLGSGTKNRSVLELSTDLISHFGSLKNLSEASVQELSSLKGIGPAKAILLKAAFSLIARLPTQADEKALLDQPRKIYDLINGELTKEKVEVLMVLLLDTKRRLIHKEVAARGILNEILIHPREIFHLAIRHRAHSVAIAHNHPSGDPAPSKRDLEMTKILQSAGQIVGISLYDHLIIGGGHYTSFAEKGLL
ncbi:MAG: DNA repair protein RadC [Verrucomicrobia bacterium]|nr:DNA repair protein RadC [Verrucomicrobiota bacterium]